MVVYMFRCEADNIYGFSNESDGKNLPSEECSKWDYLRSTEADRSFPSIMGMNPSDLLDAIESKGFYTVGIDVVHDA